MNEFPFFKEFRAGQWAYQPNYALVTETAAKRPRVASPFSLNLLLIDNQNCFTLPEGPLFVAGQSGQGALHDTRRLAEFVLSNADSCNEIIATACYHTSIFSLFFAAAWQHHDGSPVAPFTTILHEDVKSGRYILNPQTPKSLDRIPSWLHEYVLFYTQKLEEQGRGGLTVWPRHGIPGTPEQAQHGMIAEAMMYAELRGAHTRLAVKGMSPFTEQRTAITPDIAKNHMGSELPEHPLNSHLNFIAFMAYQRLPLVVAGQSSSHCLGETLIALLDRNIYPSRIYVLEDCTSALVVRDRTGAVTADFTEKADRLFATCRGHGVNFVKSTDPVMSWPGIERFARS